MFKFLITLVQDDPAERAIKLADLRQARVRALRNFLVFCVGAIATLLLIFAACATLDTRPADSELGEFTFVQSWNRLIGRMYDSLADYTVMVVICLIIIAILVYVFELVKEAKWIRSERERQVQDQLRLAKEVARRRRMSVMPYPTTRGPRRMPME